MSNLVEVKIPTNANPFTVTVNGKKYSYPAGATVQVPPEVAEVIEQIGRGPNLPPSSGGVGNGGGGADLLNEKGVIKQQHLPENFPYKEGEESVILPELTFVATADAALPAFALKIGNTYSVNLNGAEYKCVAQDYAGIGVAIGNLVMIAGQDTGEPFIIVVANPDYGEEASFMPMKELLGTQVTLSISDKTETITKIGKEYLPAGYPYSEVSEGFILPETTVTPDENGAAALTDALGLVEGQTYIVNWNGTDYECVCAKAEMDGDGDGVVDTPLGVALGNSGLMTGGNDTGEPFVIVESLPEFAAQAGAPVMVQALDGSTEGTVSIFGMAEVVTPIAQKFLPDIDKGIEIVELYGSLAANGTEHELSHARADIERAVDAGKIVVLKHAFNKSSSSVRFLHLSSMGSGSIVFSRQETAGQAVRFEEIIIGTSDTIEYRKGIINAEVTYSGLITEVTMSTAEVTT